MLPWNKKKEAAAAAMPIQKREHDEDFEYDSMESAADDLLMALEKKDSKGIAAALRAAFDLFDSEPHVEGPHINE